MDKISNCFVVIGQSGQIENMTLKQLRDACGDNQEQWKKITEAFYWAEESRRDADKW